MGNAENVQLVRDFCDAWNGPDVPKILGMFADDAIYHNMPFQPIQGKDAIKGVIEQFTAPFDRTEWDLNQVAATGDVVLTERLDRFIVGDKTVALPVMGAFEIKDGKIAAWRDYFDMADWTRQNS